MKLEEIDEPTDELCESIYVHLREHNQQSNPIAWAAREEPGNQERPLNLFAFGDGDEPVGGLFGTTQFSWLKIDIMAVPKELRGKGIGNGLLAKAEGIAQTRGCKYAFTDTMDYQAPDFYKQSGYAVVGEITDWDSHGHTKFFFKKAL